MIFAVAPPVVTASDVSIEAVEDHDPEVVLTFLSHSFPLPRPPAYEHNTQPLSFDDERILTLANGSVRILNPTRADSGEYTLTVVNELGNASASIALTILCETLTLLNS